MSNILYRYESHFQEPFIWKKLPSTSPKKKKYCLESMRTLNHHHHWATLQLGVWALPSFMIHFYASRSSVIVLQFLVRSVIRPFRTCSNHVSLGRPRTLGATGLWDMIDFWWRLSLMHVIWHSHRSLWNFTYFTMPSPLHSCRVFRILSDTIHL